MTAQQIMRIRTVLILTAGLLASCGGGSYGGDGGGRPPATLTISVSPTTITLGESATLTWNSNAPDCTASGAWNGSKPGNGTEEVTPTETGTLTYSLVCSGGRYGESDQASATLTVNPARQAAVFVGEACCDGAEKFAVEGIRNQDGELRMLALGRHLVGKPGRQPVAFAAGDTTLAGARLSDRSAIDLRTLTLREQPSDTETLEGQFTTHLGTGYTLTITIDAAGRLTGIDTRGCRLDGRAHARTPRSPVFGVLLNVSACGERDGRFVGDAALLSESGSQAGGLLLSASNEKAAIGWRLSR